MERFCKALPKIELHAHLNGSLSNDTLHELANLKGDESQLYRDSIAQFTITEDHQHSLQRCFEVFKIAQALTDTAAAVKLAVSNTVKEFDEDNVIYLELRSTPRENSKMTKLQYIQAMVDGVEEASKNVSIETRLLISVDRRNSLEQTEDTVRLAIEMYARYPNVIVGMDLSGDPGVGRFEEIGNALKKAQMAGLKITIHAGEIPNDNEIIDIINWRPNRLGHMTVLSDDNCSEEIVKAGVESNIPIELCLTSNIKSGTVKNYERHHFQLLYNLGYPISLGTDDKGVFNTSLSNEFFICSETFNLDKDELWKISYEAVQQIFAEDLKCKLSERLNGFKTEIKI